MEKSSHREMERTVQFAELGKGIGKEKDIKNGTKQGGGGNDVGLIIYSCSRQLLTNPCHIAISPSFNVPSETISPLQTCTL